MTARLTQFQAELTRSRDLIGLGQSLGSMTHGAVDAGDLYRAALVQAVAAMDAYIHGIVLDRATDILMGRLTGPVPTTRVGLAFSAVQAIMGASSPSDAERIARGHIAQRLSTETFQRADDIAQALASVGIPRIWKSAFPSDPELAKRAINVVVQRRNQIVHQCDASPLSPGSLNPMSDMDALHAVSEVESKIHAIDTFC